MADPKRELLQQQANAKVYWGASEREVLSWLTVDKAIPEAEAQTMVEEAFRIRSATIRRRALIYLVFSVIGLAITGFFIVIWWNADVRRGWYLVAAIGAPSLAAFFRSIQQLALGDSEDPLE